MFLEQIAEMQAKLQNEQKENGKYWSDFYFY